MASFWVSIPEISGGGYWKHRDGRDGWSHLFFFKYCWLKYLMVVTIVLYNSLDYVLLTMDCQKTG